MKNINNIPVFFYEETESTNVLAREYARENSSQAFFISDRQTKGMGRKGRSFISENGGIYLSFVFKPKEETKENILRLTTAVCVLVCECIERVCKKTTRIKWVNDIYYNEKKICGILTQGVTGEKGIESVIVGIGINFSTPENAFPDELKSIAGSLFNTHDGEMKRALTEALMDELIRVEDLCISGDYLEKYRERSLVLNKPVRFFVGDEAFDGVAVDIDENGGLTVETEKGQTTLSTGEITLRIREDAK